MGRGYFGSARTCSRFVPGRGRQEPPTLPIIQAQDLRCDFGESLVGRRIVKGPATGFTSAWPRFETTIERFLPRSPDTPRVAGVRTRHGTRLDGSLRENSSTSRAPSSF